MEKYKPLIDATLSALTEAAKLTDTPLDDQGVAAVRAVFDTLFGPLRFGAELDARPSDEAAVTAVETAGLPIWAVPIVLEIVKLILNRWGK